MACIGWHRGSATRGALRVQELSITTCAPHLLLRFSAGLVRHCRNAPSIRFRFDKRSLVVALAEKNHSLDSDGGDSGGRSNGYKSTMDDGSHHQSKPTNKVGTREQTDEDKKRRDLLYEAAILLACLAGLVMAGMIKREALANWIKTLADKGKMDDMCAVIGMVPTAGIALTRTARELAKLTGVVTEASLEKKLEQKLDQKLDQKMEQLLEKLQEKMEPTQQRLRQLDGVAARLGVGVGARDVVFLDGHIVSVKTNKCWKCGRQVFEAPCTKY